MNTRRRRQRRQRDTTRIRGTALSGGGDTQLNGFSAWKHTHTTHTNYTNTKTLYIIDILFTGRLVLWRLSFHASRRFDCFWFSVCKENRFSSHRRRRWQSSENDGEDDDNECAAAAAGFSFSCTTADMLVLIRCSRFVNEIGGAGSGWRCCWIGFAVVLALLSLLLLVLMMTKRVKEPAAYIYIHESIKQNRCSRRAEHTQNAGKRDNTCMRHTQLL